MTPTELMVELAKRGVKAVNLEGLKGISVCPHCGHTGPVTQDFGVRVMRGEVWPQSWCRICRAGKAQQKRAALKYRPQ